MRDNYTHICVVLDASGSMSVLHETTIQSFNEFIQTQKKEEGKTVVDVFQFANSTRRIVKSLDISTINENLMSDYVCAGCTAMYDAICTAIDTLGKEFAAMPEHERPANVLVAILTDGLENASRQFTCEDVKKRIKLQTETYSWEFMFLAANQDAVLSGGRFGIEESKCRTLSMIDMSRGFGWSLMADRAASMRRKKKNQN